jgi:hypothetical protein
MRIMGKCPESEVRVVGRQAQLRTSDSKDTCSISILVWFGSEIRLTVRGITGADFRTTTPGRPEK